MPPKVDKKTNMAPTFETLLNSLSEIEKNRFVCAILNGNLSDVDWENAARDFGSASAASMSKCYSNSLKKLDEKKKSLAVPNEDMAEETGDSVGTDIVTGGGLDNITPPPSPVTTKKPRAPAKAKAGRKTKAASEDNGTAASGPGKTGSKAGVKKGGPSAGTKRKAVPEPDDNEEGDHQGVEDAVAKMCSPKKPAAKRGRPAKQSSAGSKKGQNTKTAPETKTELSIKPEDAESSHISGDDSLTDNNEGESTVDHSNEHQGEEEEAVDHATDVESET